MQWIVQPGDGEHVSDILAQLEALGAGSGRVFVNGRPAEPSDEIDPGDRLELYPTRPVDLAGVAILAQRDGVVLAHKPAGLPTETTQAGQDSLVSELITRLKGGHVHAATRLDVMVSGVVACTLGRDASRRMASWREAGLVRRTYLGIAKGSLEADEGRWQWPLGRKRDRGGRVRSSPEGREPLEASTHFEVLARAGEATLLRLQPESGRMHQLRAHAALAGAPLFGDPLYGGPRNLTLADGRVTEVGRLALHATSVELPHLGASAPLPEAMVTLWNDLGAALPEDL